MLAEAAVFLAALNPIVVPNDEADGGRVVTAPRLVVISPGSPAWMKRSTPWGDSRGRRFVPPEQDSPLCPYFQPSRWDAPAFAASAGSCRAACDRVGECDGREKALTAVPFAALLGLLGVRRYRTRTRTRGE
jgi:hypothetical protein